jgi:hypothetical protein
VKAPRPGGVPTLQSPAGPTTCSRSSAATPTSTTKSSSPTRSLLPYLPLNELVTRAGADDLTRTPDISGRCFTGTLTGYASIDPDMSVAAPQTSSATLESTEETVDSEPVASGAAAQGFAISTLSSKGAWRQAPKKIRRAAPQKAPS